jgi:hypothetical protein
VYNLGLFSVRPTTGMYRTFAIVDVINRERNEAIAQHTSGNLKLRNIQHPLLPKNEGGVRKSRCDRMRLKKKRSNMYKEKDFFFFVLKILCLFSIRFHLGLLDAYSHQCASPWR